MKAIVVLCVAVAVYADDDYSFFDKVELQKPQLPWDQPPPDDEECILEKNFTREDRCDYVKEHDDQCEGGGYLLWTQYIECTKSTTAKVFAIIGGVIVMFALFIFISTVTDGYFAPNVAGIVQHLKISESVAGVTFMAFGNGAPDIFNSIASILGTAHPRAGLALGGLLGGGMFITTCVLASIILTTPFRIDIFATIRDILFYIAAVGFILYIFLSSDEVQTYQPCVFLGIYGVYVLIVVLRQVFYARRKRAKLRRQQQEQQQTQNTDIEDSTSEKSESSKDENDDEQKSTVNSIYSTISSGLPSFELGPNEKAVDVEGCCSENTELPEAEDVIVVHNHVYLRDEVPPPKLSLLMKSWAGWWSCLGELRAHFSVIPSKEKWKEMKWHEKITEVLGIIPNICCRATIPLHEYDWSKTVALMLCFTAPQFVLFAIQKIHWSPFKKSPGLWIYGLAFSLAISVLVSIITRFDSVPRFYKQVYSYLGFLASIAWIYLLASEIVGVVSMIGVISRISSEVLGLTILAWSNCIGDVIADRAVAKQGFPRMAMAAALGGPLFNLLVGFGLPFAIARAKKKTISIFFSPVYHFLILFLGISLISTLIGCFLQRFYLRRPHAIVLITIYIVFLVLVILSETRVLVWN